MKKDKKRTCKECDTVLTGTDLKFCPDCRPQNENCLANVECPECGQNESFQISFRGEAKVQDDGSEGDGNHEWDEDSDCTCNGDGCSYMGILKDFTVGTPEFVKMRQQALDRLSGKLPPKGFGDGTPGKKKFFVVVKRIMPQFLRIPVIATTVEEAKKLALEKAGDSDFRNGTTGGEAEYEADEVTEVD